MMLDFKNKSGSLWPIFHGSVILPYIFKAIWGINMIPWNNESVWLDALPQNKTMSLCPVFHGSVILPYILKAIWCINMILWANKSVWLDAWPQNKSWSLWPIFHGSVAYILKTILCIRRWHWPGVYVSPCSLALVSKSKGPSKTLRDIRTSTYQIYSIEEKIFEQPHFTNDYVIWLL